MTDIINEFEIAAPPLTKMSDHSVLICSMNINNIVLIDESENCQKYVDPVKKYSVKNIPENFMCSDECKLLIEEAIHNIEKSIDEEKDIKKACNELVALIRSEMDTHLHEVWSKKTSSNNPKLKQKPWWDDTIQQLWNKVCKAEKLYLAACRNGGSKQQLKQEFAASSSVFFTEISRGP